MPILVHYLLVYDHLRQELRLPPREFSDGAEAAAAYADLEEKHREDSHLEIVLVGAESLDVIRQTHGHYFNREDASFPYLAAVT